MCFLWEKEQESALVLKVVKKKMLTLRLLFQQYVEAGGGPFAVFETEPTALPLFTVQAKSEKPLMVRDMKQTETRSISKTLILIQ